MAKSTVTISVNPNTTKGTLAQVGFVLQSALTHFFDFDTLDQSLLTVTQPPSPKMGDLAFSCFAAAAALSLGPPEFAKKLEGAITKELKIAQKHGEQPVVKEAVATGPYLNLFLNRMVAKEQLVSAVETAGSDYGANSSLSGRTIMVEYLAPNTNKPLHIGHLRNGVIGTSVANLLRVSGANVVRANNINDRGIHITQSMFAYKMWSHGETPTTAGEKGDHFVGRYYVMFHQEVAKQYLEWLTAKGISPDQLADKDKKKMRKEFERQCPLIQRAYEMLSRWEAEDPETVSQWKQMNNWVYEGFEQTNARIGFNFERVYYESRTYKLGKDIVLKQADEGFGQKVADGSIAIDLSDVKLGKDPVTLLRADGTSVYITQDIGLAVTRFNEIPQLSGVTYVVAREQEFHFKCLFEILRRYGYPWYGQLFHLSYGMVNLASGKMKSREGTVVDADDLMNDLHGIVAEIIKRNEPEATQQEIGRRAEAVALGALKYMLASTSPNNDILFKPEESVKFEGNTGPYLQYACVRIAAIEAKARDLPLQNSEEVADPEFELIKELNLYPKAVQEAADAYDPSIVASYLYDLAKRFSVFYTECQVVYDGKVNASRLAICKTTKQVLSNGLELLGIPVPDRM